MTLFGEQVTVDRNIAKEIGITGVSTAPLNWGVPNVGWQGYRGIGSNGLTQGNVLHNYQLTDDLTWVRGGHTIKMGYDIRQSRFRRTATTDRGEVSRSTPATRPRSILPQATQSRVPEAA